MSTEIRSVKENDFEAVFLLFKQLWPNKELNKYDLFEVFKRGIISENDEYYCAEVNGEVIGFCSYAIVNNFWQAGYIGYVYSMIVDGAFRGKGIGTDLLKRILESARERNCKKVELDSGFPREQAHKFYEKLGFEKRAYLFSKDV